MSNEILYKDELDKARIHVFLGGYGSGKTELALSAAFSLAALGYKTCLVDVDIVNPYLRSSDKRIPLEQAGVRVIAPVFAMTNVDTPVLSPAIKSVFDSRLERAVFDVGGDASGSAAIGGYADKILADDSRAWYVINTSRPLSSSAEENAARVAQISARSRLRVSGLIHNTNLQHETTPEIVVDSFGITERVAQLTGIPIAAVTGEAELAQSLPPHMRRIFSPIVRRTAYQF